MRIKIAARKSDLARLQARLVGEALLKINPQLQIDYFFKASLGDKNLDDPLWTMGSKGVFTEDFYNDLINHAVDLVVHSWKDLPMEDRAGTEIAATLPREDIRDVLLLKKDQWPRATANKNLRILSSSPRRIHNLSTFLPAALPAEVKCEFASVRGNIPTRLKKLIDGEGQALVVAKAALDRLLKAEGEEFKAVREQVRAILQQCYWMVLPLCANPAAAAQGALALEVRQNSDASLLNLLAQINCPATQKAVLRERQMLSQFGGGCHLKIGVSVISRPYGDIVFMRGLSPSGQMIDKVEKTSKVTSHFPPAARLENLWPQPGERQNFFSRQECDDKNRGQEVLASASALWVTRNEAWPKWFSGHHEKIVWTGGIKTWRQLARRGIWVNGCAESLGEQENPSIEAITGKPVCWLKLSHLNAPRGDDKEHLATYKLVANEVVPDLRGKTHFYWLSASAYLRALEMYPEIQNGYHGCGPGNTFAILRTKIAPDRLQIFLSQEEWLKTVWRSA